MKVRFSLVIVVSASVWAFTACTYDTIPSPVECPDPPVLAVDLVENSDCGAANGSIALSATGGLAPYTFQLEGGDGQSNGLFENLSAGLYNFQVSDSNGCTNTITSEVRNANGLNISITSTNSDCQSNDGNITITAEGGVEPYSFRINGQSPQASGSFANLSPGEYAVVVSDATGCEISNEVQILSDVVFDQIKSIISANCAVSNCHNGSVNPDLRDNQNIRSRAGRIQARTGARTMPPNGRTITDTQIQEIACWVSDGANL